MFNTTKIISLTNLLNSEIIFMNRDKGIKNGDKLIANNYKQAINGCNKIENNEKHL